MGQTQYSTQMGTPFPPLQKRYQHGMHDKFSNKILQRLIDWGPIDQPAERDETTGGPQTWLPSSLQQEHDKPFLPGMRDLSSRICPGMFRKIL